MHRIDAAGFAVGNLFTDGNPSTGTPATVVDAAWLNDLQENVAQLVEAAGIVLSKGDYTQLLKAIVTKGLQGCYFNIGTAAGTADAITSSYTPAITALANGMTLYVRAASTNATTTPTFTPASGTIAAKTIVKGAGSALAAGDIAGGGHWIELQYDATLDKWVLLNPATGVTAAVAIKSTVRQTVLASPVDSSGLPTFLPATSASLSITSQNITSGAPLIVSTANGFDANGAVDRIGKAIANLTWSGLTASSTNYLGVIVASDGSLTPFVTSVSAPVYQPGGTPSNTANIFTFNWQQMIGYLGTGAAAPQSYIVIVGEAVTNASTVTSTVVYALHGRYDSGLFAVSGSTSYAKNHNLGTLAYNIDFTLADDTSGTNERPASATYNIALTSANGWYAGASTRLSASIVFPGAPIGCSAGGASINSGYGRIRARRAF